jgi:uncharacterized protein YrrD
MKKSREIIGLTVVSIQEGKELGTVNHLVIDAANGAVAALLIDDGKWYLGARVLPFSTINALGENAVTINSEADIQSVTPNSVFDNLLIQNSNVVGTLALTRGGNVNGTVAEIIIDADGKIIECLIDDAEEVRSISAQRVITYGKDVLIISADSELPPVRREVLNTEAPLPIIDEPVKDEEPVQYPEVEPEQSEPAEQEADM